MSNKVSLAFIGLGVMGYPMAGWLSRKGYRVTVYNRTQTVAERWITDFEGALANSPAIAAQDADVVFLCVGDDNDVSDVMLGGQGVLAGMVSDSIVVDHTTTSEALATSLAASADQSGVAFLDAPVSGGQIGAENGALTVMIGADEQAFTEAQPLIECYANSVRRMGPVGAGQLTKMVNQICIAGLLQGLAEGIHFAERAGLDVPAAVEVIAQGAAQSWQMNNRAETMIRGEFDFGFAVDWMRKDLGIAIEAAQSVGAEVPVTQLVDTFYADVQGLGGHRWDTSSLIQRLRAGEANR